MAEKNENATSVAKEETLKEIVKNIAKSDGIIKELVIREGKAKNVYDPEPYKVKGTIDAPARWVESKLIYKNAEGELGFAATMIQNQCVVEVNRDANTITLITEHNDHFRNEIGGTILLSKEFKEFGINTGKSYTSIDLAQFIKMHRSCFESKAEANKLVNELMSIKYNVQKQLERTENNRGDRRLIAEQTIKTNMPETITMVMPVFKGFEGKKFNVELYISPDDYSCQLISPDAQDIIDEESAAIIDAVIERIKVAAPYITIIEV